MTELSSVCPKFYQTPSDGILENRKAFYSIQKQNAESVDEWLWRIRDFVDGCEFGILREYLLIDKFVSGLGESAIQKLRTIETWSLDQLLAVVDQRFFIDNGTIEFMSEPEINSNETLNNVSDIDEDEIDRKQSHSEEDQNLYDLKSILDEKKNEQIEHDELESENGIYQITKSILISKKREIKGFVIDEQNRYHCLDCSKTFKQKSSYTQHKRLHTGKNIHSCNECGKIFLKPSKLKSHFVIHKREQKNAGKTFECHLCRFQFIRLQGLRIHINVKHVTDSKIELQCKICNETFLHQISLHNHLRNVHQTEALHKCPHCSKEFEHISHMKEHLTIHSEAKPFMCEICGNAFRTKKQLHLHMTRHTNERRFKCGECGQMLKSRSNYKNHMRQHTGERPFKCSQCEKTFVQRANYLKHLRVHTGERPHGCTFCEKRFPTAYDMKLHINSIHTGARPFVCKQCDRSFSQPSTLRVHRMRVHP